MKANAGGKNTMVFLLAMVGMVCWGVAPIFVKLGLNQINPIIGLSVRTLITGTFLFSWMLLDGSIVQFRTIPLSAVLLLTIEAILATLIGDLAYFAAVKKGTASLVTIIMSSSPLITVMCSVIFLGEHMTFIRIIGSCLIILGITLIV